MCSLKPMVLMRRNRIAVEVLLLIVGFYHMIEMMGPLLMTKMMPLWYMLMMLL